MRITTIVVAQGGEEERKDEQGYLILPDIPDEEE